MRRKLPIIIIVGVLIAALGGSALLLNTSSTSTPQTNIAQLPPTISNSNAPVNPPVASRPPAAASNITPSTHVRGRADAPVLIEEYGDFQCPPCGYLHPILKRVESEFEKDLRVVFRHFPLRNMHKNAAEAARAAEAAGIQGKFWQMHDLLFEKQNEWKDAAPARSLFLNYARTLGLNLEKFTQDIDSIMVSNRVLNDENEGASRGVTGTPTMFINGRELTFEESTNYEKLRANIEREIAAKK